MTKPLLILLALVVGGFLAADAFAAGSATKRVAIVHVQKGCHVWSVGALKKPAISVSLRRGDSLAVVNQDLDMHQLVQVSGPSTKTGAFMMMNQRIVLRFPKVGVYRFHTRVADMRGMPEAETIGPDNKLVLTVTVR